MTSSPAEALASLPPSKRRRHVASLSDDEVAALLRSWHFWSRPEQRAPVGSWRWWAMVTGRGYGKNRSGSEWVVDRCEQFARHRHPHKVALLNRSFNHVRSLQIEGESGLAAVCERRGHKLEHASTSLEGELQVKVEGQWHTSTLEVHTADDPDRVRGRNLHTIHADEAAAWRHKQDAEGSTAFTNADLGLRALCPPGMEPQGMVTTTPKPIPLVKDLLAGVYGRTAITRGSLFDNASNLAAGYIDAILRKYANTRLGAQEVEGLVLEDIEGALWTSRGIELDRYRGDITSLALDPVVIGVDPPGETTGAECGIIVAGAESLDTSRDPRYRHAYVIDDRTKAAATPEEWATEVVRAYRYWNASVVVAEVNNGGDMVRAVIHNIDPTVKVEKVRATVGKRLRAEPVSALYDQHRVHHWLEFVDLESQLTTWTPADPTSPDRLDALVWALTFLGDALTSMPAKIGLPLGPSGGQGYAPAQAGAVGLPRR